MSKTTLIPLFPRLSHVDPRVREKTTARLLAELTKAQQNATKEVPMSAELSYSLKRLVMALSSPNEASRQGFSVALTEVIKKFDIVKISELCQLADKFLTMKEPTLAVLFGRIFFIAVLSRSNKLFDDINSNREVIVECVSHLLHISKIRIVAAEMCVQVLIGILEKMPYKFYKDSIAALVSPILDQKIDNYTPETLLLLLAVNKFFPDETKDRFGGKSLFDASVLKQFATTLADSNSASRVHSIWDFIISEAKAADSLIVLWNTVIEGEFLEIESRKHLALLLFVKFMQAAEPHQISALFTKRFLRCFSANLRKNAPMVRTARYVAHAMVHLAQENNNALVAIGSTLRTEAPKLLKNSILLFFKKNISVDTADEYINRSIKAFYTCIKKDNGDEDEDKDEDEDDDEDDDDDDDEESEGISEPQAVVDNLFDIGTTLVQHDDVSTKILKFFYTHGFYHAAADSDGKDCEFAPLPRNAMSQLLRERCEEHFLTLLASVVNDPASNERIARVCDSLIAYSKTLEESPSFTPLNASSEEETEARKSNNQIFATIEKYRKGLDAPQEVIFANIATLVRLLFLYQLKNPLASEQIQELEIVISKLFSEKGDKASQDAEEPNPINVLVDLMVSILFNNSPILFGPTVKRIFRTLTPQLTHESLQIILDVLALKDDVNPEEYDSDEEMIDIGEAKEEEEEEEEDGNKEKAPKQTNGTKANREEKKAPRDGKKKKQEEKESEDEEEEELMDDEQMFQFDKHLSAIFMQKYLETKQKRELRHFKELAKREAVDMIGAFITDNPTNPLILDVFEPLFTAMKETKGKKNFESLYAKLHSTFVRLCESKKYPTGIDGEKLRKLMGDFFAMLIKSTFAPFAQATRLAIFYLTAVATHDTSAPRNATIVTDHFTSYFATSLKKSKNDQIFVAQFAARFPKLSWKLIPSVVEIASQIENARRRLNALNFLHTILTCHQQECKQDAASKSDDNVRLIEGAFMQFIRECADKAEPKTLGLFLDIFSSVIKRCNNTYPEVLNKALIKAELEKIATRPNPEKPVPEKCRRCIAALEGGNNKKSKDNNKKRKRDDNHHHQQQTTSNTTTNTNAATAKTTTATQASTITTASEASSSTSTTTASKSKKARKSK